MAASADSSDSYGVTDFAIGVFRQDEGFASACRRLVQRWWQARADDGGSAWEYLFHEGLIDEVTAEGMRDEVWIDDPDMETTA